MNSSLQSQALETAPHSLVAPASRDEIPTLVIRPRRGWQALELAEVWRYRHLIRAFVGRDLAAAQKQTALGVLWLFLAPLFSVAVFAFVFGRLARLPSDGMPYPLFVFAGHLAWTAFAPALLAVTQSLVASGQFIRKVYFPRLIIPAAAALSGVVNIGVMSIGLMGMMLWYGYWPGWTTLVAIPIVAAILLTAFGLGLLLAPLNVKYRDVGMLTQFALQLGMFLTPVVYPVSVVPEPLRQLLGLNPMAGYIGMLRWSLYGGAAPVEQFAAGILITLALLFAGAFTFARTQGRVADII